MKKFRTPPEQSTAGKLWSLSAAERGAKLVRGGQCCVETEARYDVTLADGRRFLGCGVRGRGASRVLVLLESSHGFVALAVGSEIVEVSEHLPLAPADWTAFCASHPPSDILDYRELLDERYGR